MNVIERELTILLVENSADDASQIIKFLKEEIIKPIIHHAKTFDQARESLTRGFHYDVILLDVSLQDNTAGKQVSDLGQLANDIPVIVLCSGSDKEFTAKTLSPGISDCLRKSDLNGSYLTKSIAYNLEKKSIAHKLRDSEERYQSLFSFSPIPMWVFDVDTLKFLNVNEAAIRNYGYSREEFLNMTIKDIRPEEDIEMVESIVKANKKSGIFSWGEYRHIKKTGELIYVDIKSNLIEFEGNRARLVLSLDITDRVRYMQAIEEQNERLYEIAWSQSHVVRAPLARMMGLLNMLSLKKTGKKEPKEILELVMSSARELDDIVRDIVRKSEVIKNYKE
ncbi:hypothetical protein C900_00743 [Fulvivirga imtechensis AK7]|uniref:histidine kinase n=1 Tax=Fulvivirga imtechensis AK7 TaxID=1237149 RepID=L8JZZ9_9BACT|nr:PAS domain S-box protein [Fulvivirga imtechensis]ELR72782.1 hypothetical protein C900_00743 [Fulvivirga imtechensis AK7]